MTSSKLLTEAESSQLIVYTLAAKCTLMANIPRGDIELSFNSPVTTSAKSSGQQQNTPYMRIRFSRQGHFMELSQHLSSLQGEEWTKKSLPSTSSPPYISTDSWTTLEGIEKEAIQQLVHFVRTCEAVEGLLVLDELPQSQTANRDTNFKPVTPQLQTRPLKPISYSIPTIVNSLSSVKLAQRPSKLATSSSAGKKRDDISKSLDRSREPGDVAMGGVRSTLDAIDSVEWCVEEFTNGSRGVQTRFLPSVGWCIRYGSRVSQGGRYRIMFLDGIALDIDVDEDWAELRSESGHATR
jgi:polo-like kinase 4